VKITKEELKRIIKEEVEEIAEIRVGGGMGSNPQSVEARERLGLQMDSYIEEAGGGGFKTPTPEDTVLDKIVKSLKKLKGDDDDDDKELSADEKRAKLKRQIKNKAYADKILKRYKAKKGL